MRLLGRLCLLHIREVEETETVPHTFTNTARMSIDDLSYCADHPFRTPLTSAGASGSEGRGEINKKLADRARKISSCS